MMVPKTIIISMEINSSSIIAMSSLHPPSLLSSLLPSHPKDKRIRLFHN